MRYKGIHIEDAYKAINNNTVNNPRGTYVEIDKLIKELQTISSETIVAVAPNCLDLTISHISDYLARGGNPFVATLTDVATVTCVSRPTLNEWKYCGIISTSKRYPRQMKKQQKLGYDIAELLDQLKAYRKLAKLYKMAQGAEEDRRRLENANGV